MFRYLGALALAGGLLACAGQAHAQVYISEFMANNVSSAVDEDGDHPDWIEIYNASTGTISLLNWYLTDNGNDLRKWRFPAVSLTSGARRIVFASDKDRRNPGANLHTNFKLSDNGEFLALVRADGGTIEHAYSPEYPPQAPNVSYGFSGVQLTARPVVAGASARYAVPASYADFTNSFTNATLNWAALSFNDSGWTACQTGIGFDTGTLYAALISSNGNVQAPMLNSNASIFVRIPFVATNAAQVANIRLLSKHDDGFVAYLNGTRVMTDLAPTVVASQQWCMAATGDRLPPVSSTYSTYIITNLTNALILAGSNVLALQGLNQSSNSPDFLVLPELELVYSNSVITNFTAMYLNAGTPGSDNSAGRTNIGPAITGVTDSPPRPLGTTFSPSIVVTASVTATLRPVSAVRLHYRAMFSNESTVTMMSIGSNRYVGSIPTTNLLPSQMMRWRIAAVDNQNVTNTAPSYFDPTDSDQYYGTVALDPSVTNSRLPIYYWYVANIAAAQTETGTRCSIFYRDRFYDNVLVKLHGQTSSGFPKKPHDFDFNAENQFIWDDDEEEVDDINFLTNYADKTKYRNSLGEATMRDATGAGLVTFMVRSQRNGTFHGIYDMNIDPDEKWLAREGLDPAGALYKIYNSLDTAATGAEKKTRQFEDKSDLQNLIDNIVTSAPLADRVRYAYDNINIPQSIDYFVGRALISDTDHGHKNYYMYRASTTSGEWTIFPWDIDLSFGHTWTGYYTNDALFQANAIHMTTANRFYQLIYNGPEFGRMYLRRMRTCMDRFLQAPTTPTNELRWEYLANYWIDLIDPPGIDTNATDAQVDFATWGTPYPTNNVPPRTENERVKGIHFAGRRDYLFNQNPKLTNGLAIPPSQPLHMPIRFGAYEVRPSLGGNGSQAQEYFTLVNTNNIYVDISGWRITGAVNYTFSPGVVIPTGGGTNQNIGILYVAKSNNSFRSRASSPRASEYCFVVGGYEGQMSARGESLFLIDDTGTEIASLNWGNSSVSDQTNARITEIMYHPAPPTFAESNAIPFVLDQDFEFIEVMNRATSTTYILNYGIRLSEGVEFTSSGVLPYLSPGEFGVYVANSNAFRLRYGNGPKILGTYTGFLDNAGERLQILERYGEVIQDFSFNNAWYPSTDGHGFSLVIRDVNAPWDAWGQKGSWRPSGNRGGNPGAADPGDPGIAQVMINESLTHTDLPDVDTIELFNTNAVAVDIGNWWLTDDFLVPRKFRIPTNTVIAANGYAAFDENDFNFPTNAPTAFRISSVADDLWLFSADGASNLTGYVATRKFGAAQNGFAFGRHVNRAREEFFVAQSTNTAGLTNAYPRVGPAVISEIMYHPLEFTSIIDTNDNDRDEFIELANVSGGALPLYDPAFPTNTWRLRNAVDYDFPPGVSLPAGGRLIVVGFDPSVVSNATGFRAAYGLSTNVPLYGPWSGKLANSGENIELKRPDTPNIDVVPYILVEDVSYDDEAPWPVAADGQGKSLARIELAAFGNDPYNWYPASPTPISLEALDLDSDGDGMADWAEHYAGTDPTNSLSLLQMISVAPGPGGPAVQWSSISGKTYVIECATNLLGETSFVPMQTGLPASPPAGIWIDGSATNGGMKSYRIRVEP